MPQISVCIASYNGEKYIKEQLESILNQIGENDEVVISDDASTDKTILIIESFNDKRIHLYKNSIKFENHNLNFENALRYSSGDNIFLSDQDDVWIDNKIDKMIQELKSSDLVLSDYQLVDVNLCHINGIKVKKNNLSIWNVFYKNPYMGCCMAFNRNVLTRCLPFYNKIPMHDMWIGLIASLYFKTKYIPDKLILHRRHGRNVSFTSMKSQNTFYQKIIYRINLFQALIYACFKR